jgi:hypothetical protein
MWVCIRDSLAYLSTTDIWIVSHILFETGSDELRGMEEKIYVGSGRFIVEKGKPVVVEYKISEVVA